MITGNITLKSKPDESGLRTDVICTSCDKPCKEVAIDLSFNDGFGLVRDWGVGSDCCQAECRNTEE